AGAIFGFFGLEYVTLRPFNWMESKLRSTPLADIATATGGLSVGLFLAALVGYFLRTLPYGLNIVVGAALALLFGYWGLSLGLGRRDEMLALIRGEALQRSHPTILDTSVVIDGRIADIARTGFLTSRLIAPHFMLVELQTVADSSDATRRQRGRRGLAILDEMKRLPGLQLDFLDTDYPDVADVDHKLIRLAKEVHGSILTTDYNLNRVASLEGVTVLNVNDLGNALKSAVIAGEELIVTPLKEGKESNQGVGYLTDGTMVVIEGGRQHLNEQLRVAVTSVIQTAAGRMIFAAVNGGSKVLPGAPPPSRNRG
ncbi:MAG: PIN/TRAM domain-containing protein, partial [Candidatus Dormibacteria bacterium]